MQSMIHENERRPRCGWAVREPSISYHDAEWGTKLTDDRMLSSRTLEGAQAGLSWETILRKRAAYRAAYAGFDPSRLARFDPSRLARFDPSRLARFDRLRLPAGDGRGG